MSMKPLTEMSEKEKELLYQGFVQTQQAIIHDWIINGLSTEEIHRKYERERNLAKELLGVCNTTITS